MHAPGSPPSAFAAAAYFWVRSPELFGASFSEHGAEIYADVANFSETQPVRGWAEIVHPPEASGTP